MNLRISFFAVSSFLALAAVIQSGCATPTTIVADSAPQTTPAEVAGQPAKAPQPQKPQILAGKVVETMDSGGYTYVNLENNGKNIWVATPPMELKIGQEIRFNPGMEMGRFTSKTLGRTFDNIIFSSGPVNATDAQAQEDLPKAGSNAVLPKGHPEMGQKMHTPQGNTSVAAGGAKKAGAQAKPDGTSKPLDEGTISGKVVETMNGGGYTYINLENEGKKIWVAIPIMEVKVGQQIKLWSGTDMGKFSSSSLKRTFDKIFFSSGPVKETAAQAQEDKTKAGTNAVLPSGHPAMGQQMLMPQGHTPVASSGAMKAEGHAAANKTAKPTNGGTISGKAVEVMESGGYTYVNLERDGKKIWVAAPVMNVTVGQDLLLRDGPVMTNFTSKSLNRTFESVIFSSGPASK